MIDIENLLGADYHPRQVAEMISNYCASTPIFSNDLAIIASATTTARYWAFSVPPSWRRIFAPYIHDGADLALLEAASGHRLSSFGGLFIGSGDGIFTPLAMQACAQGLATTAVIGAGKPSQRLLHAVSAVCRLNQPVLVKISRFPASPQVRTRRNDRRPASPSTILVGP